MTTTTSETRRTQALTHQWSRGARQTLLVTHVLSGVGWMGLDIGIFLLALTGLRTDDPVMAATAYRAIALIVPVAVPALALGMLSTGIALGWGTKWGLLRYWWVATKLVIGTVLNVLVLTLLVPEVNALPAVGTGDLGSADHVRELVGEPTTGLLIPPVVSFVLLGVSLVLSVTKPWGRRARAWHRP